MSTSKIPVGNLQDANSGSYYPGLDVLRGVAILLILGYHMFNFIPLFEYGWLGVDLFFVLSGFLITDILLRINKTRCNIRNFYIRRVLRIFPVYYLSLFIVFFILSNIEVPPAAAHFYHTNKPWFFLYLQNWLYIVKSPDPSSFLNHYWSLALEEQFYILWPPLIFLLGNTKMLIRLLIVALLVMIILRVTLFFFPFVTLNYHNFHTFSRVDGLLIGCILGLYLKNNSVIPSNALKNIIAGVLIVNGGFIVLNSGFDMALPYYPFIGYTTFAIAAGLLIYLTVRNNKKIKSTDRRFLRFFGKISYGLYIYHWPLFLLIFPKLNNMFQGRFNLSQAVSSFFAALLAAGSAVAISYLSYLFIEVKILRLKKYFEYSTSPKASIKVQLPSLTD